MFAWGERLAPLRALTQVDFHFQNFDDFVVKGRSLLLIRKTKQKLFQKLSTVRESGGHISHRILETFGAFCE
jgi:hypothetical protein